MNYDELARVITKAGRILTENGAEIWRVEDTMYRLAKAYGATTVDSYATPTLLIISFTAEGRLTHNMKRVSSRSVDLSKMDAINSLSRQVCTQGMDVEKFDALLDEIDQQNNGNFMLHSLGSAICCFGFALFFGASLIEALIAAVIGVIVKLIADTLSQYFPSDFFIHLISAFTLTVLASILTGFFGANRDIVAISSLMILVPGLAITNAIRDSVGGDLLSGLSRATEALFIAVALAVGSALAFLFMGAL